MVVSNADVAKIFADMPAEFEPEKAEGIDAVVQFNLSGDAGGQYWVRISNGVCETGVGVVENPKMTLMASADDYAAVYAGETNPMQAFMMGKIKIQGDMSLALKLQSLLTS